jgi:zinc D-Ala-D-Ala dipeptidase
MRLRRLVVTLVLAAACATAPQIPKNRYGLEVVPDVATYQRLVAADPSMKLVDVAREIHDIRIDVRYATADNFMKQVLYPVATVYLRRPAADALRDVQRELEKEGLGLKVFDGYRPYRVTEAMWEPIRNPDYVADPAKGSRHNRGAAVDLTLVELATGEELVMPTPYDDFTEKAHHDFTALPDEAKKNREKLRNVMVRHGFEPLPSEWWHYDFSGWRRFPLMDVPLDRPL